MKEFIFVNLNNENDYTYLWSNFLPRAREMIEVKGNSYVVDHVSYTFTPYPDGRGHKADSVYVYGVPVVN
jgi:hypothetical protein